MDDGFSELKAMNARTSWSLKCLFFRAQSSSHFFPLIFKKVNRDQLSLIFQHLFFSSLSLDLITGYFSLFLFFLDSFFPAKCSGAVLSRKSHDYQIFPLLKLSRRGGGRDCHWETKSSLAAFHYRWEEYEIGTCNWKLKSKFVNICFFQLCLVANEWASMNTWMTAMERVIHARAVWRVANEKAMQANKRVNMRVAQYSLLEFMLF